MATHGPFKKPQTVRDWWVRWDHANPEQAVAELNAALDLTAEDLRQRVAALDAQSERYSFDLMMAENAAREAHLDTVIEKHGASPVSARAWLGDVSGWNALPKSDGISSATLTEDQKAALRAMWSKVMGK